MIRSAFRAGEGVVRQLEHTFRFASGKPASWNPTRFLLARVFGAEMVSGARALEAVDGALEDGGA